MTFTATSSRGRLEVHSKTTTQETPMDRAKFFAAVRPILFAGKMSDAQVEGIDAILDEAERRHTPLQHLAIILAEANHETGGHFQPVSENLNYSAKRLRKYGLCRWKPQRIRRCRLSWRNITGSRRAWRKRLGNIGPASASSMLNLQCLQEIAKISPICALKKLLCKQVELVGIYEAKPIRDLFWARHLKTLSPLQGGHEFRSF